MSAPPIICQINGPFDEVRGSFLPAQCCGEKADQIYLCEEIAPPGHRHRVGNHTILHERMGNGRPCADVEDWLRNWGGLAGWSKAQLARYVTVGVR